MSNDTNAKNNAKPNALELVSDKGQSSLYLLMITSLGFRIMKAFCYGEPQFVALAGYRADNVKGFLQPQVNVVRTLEIGDEKPWDYIKRVDKMLASGQELDAVIRELKGVKAPSFLDNSEPIQASEPDEETRQNSQTLGKWAVWNQIKKVVGKDDLIDAVDTLYGCNPQDLSKEQHYQLAQFFDVELTASETVEDEKSFDDLDLAGLTEVQYEMVQGVFDSKGYESAEKIAAMLR